LLFKTKVEEVVYDGLKAFKKDFLSLKTSNKRDFRLKNGSHYRIMVYMVYMCRPSPTSHKKY